MDYISRERAIKEDREPGFAQKAAEGVKSWVKEKIDLLKASTVDKWRAVIAEGKNNILCRFHQRKYEDISQNQDYWKNEASQAGAHLESESAKFDAEIEKATDPTLRNILEERKKEKVDEFVREESRLNKIAQGFESHTRDAKEKIEGYQKKIREVRDNFNQNIDRNVSELRERHNLQELLSNRETNRENLSFFKIEREKNEKTLLEYQSALKAFKGDKDTVEKIKGAVKSVEAKLKESKRVEQEIEKAIAKLDKNIDRVDKKTEKWLNLKRKYNNASGEEVEVLGTSDLEEPEVPIDQVQATEDRDENHEGNIDDREELKAKLDRIIEVTEELRRTIEGKLNLAPGKLEAEVVRPALKLVEELSGEEDEESNGDLALARDNLELIVKRRNFFPKGIVSKQYDLVAGILEEEAKKLKGFIEKLN